MYPRCHLNYPRGISYRDANTSLAFNAGLRSGYLLPFAIPSATHSPHGFLQVSTIPALCKCLLRKSFASTVFAVWSIICPVFGFVKYNVFKQHTNVYAQLTEPIINFRLAYGRRAPNKAPLCKGGCHANSVTGGLYGIDTLQSLRLPCGQPPPFAQGRLWLVRLTCCSDKQEFTLVGTPLLRCPQPIPADTRGRVSLRAPSKAAVGWGFCPQL